MSRSDFFQYILRNAICSASDFSPIQSTFTLAKMKRYFFHRGTQGKSCNETYELQDWGAALFTQWLLISSSSNKILVSNKMVHYGRTLSPPSHALLPPSTPSLFCRFYFHCIIKYIFIYIFAHAPVWLLLFNVTSSDLKFKCLDGLALPFCITCCVCARVFVDVGVQTFHKRHR